MRIAVIGSGISGLGAAHALAAHHDVTVYERDARPGGHSNTIDITYNGMPMAVDTGFIVYNELNYPHLTALFKTLGVKSEASNMSFAVSRDHGRFEWGGDRFATLFAQKRNLFNPFFLRMVRDILRFNARATSDLAANKLGDERLGDYLTRHGFSKSFMTDYLLPMAAAIWSTPAAEVLDFPAHSFISFFDNHRLLSGFEGRPVWRTVSGGSREYVKKITAPLGDRLHLNCGAVEVRRHAQGITVTDANGQSADYDIVILATHADITAKLVADQTEDEQRILSGVRYAPNLAYVHRDENLMPKRKIVWSAWNYLTQSGAHEHQPVTVSYWMNRLQNLDATRPLFVTLNPVEAPRQDLTFAVIEYDHPQFDRAAIESQKALPTIQGRGGLYYCGAWTGHGFHEDGLRSGLLVANAILDQAR